MYSLSDSLRFPFYSLLASRSDPISIEKYQKFVATASDFAVGEADALDVSMVCGYCMGAGGRSPGIKEPFCPVSGIG